MPKQIYNIRAFHGGLNSNSDARDIAENELHEAVDIMVDKIGQTRMMGAASTMSPPAARANSIEPGYGLFQFSHDRLGANVVSADYSGTHTGSDHSTIMTDSSATFPVDGLIGATINNITDGSSGTITDNTATTVTATLTGGDDNSWDDASNDAYTITDFPITGDDYLAFSDPDTDGKVSIYSRVNNVWSDPITGMTNNTGGQRKDIFYFVDGNLRICDSEFGNTNTNKWYGYVSRSHFTIETDGSTLSTKIDYSKWILSDQQMPAPTRGLLFNNTSGVTGYEPNGQTTGGTSSTTLIDTGAFGGFTDADFVDNDYIVGKTADSKYATISSWDSANQLTTTTVPGDWENNDYWFIYPAPGTGFNVTLSWLGSSGTWGDAIEYSFASSFVYDDNQETDLYYFNQTHSSVNNARLLLSFRCTGNFDARYTGYRLYYRETGYRDSPWLSLAEISLIRGARSAESESWSGWTHYSGGWEDSSGVNVIPRMCSCLVISPTTALTYSILSGVPEDKRITSLKYKTAVIANRRAYIGNVQYTDNNSIVHTKGDTVIKSPVNQFDIFSLIGTLEVSINDGDNIVKLESYADRLLIFKKKKLELLNISQEIEFVEDIFMHKGVSHPAATCETDFGIAWVNEQGCYLYDGQRVNNLLEKGGRQIIKESDWATFATANSMIGYIPSKRQILVVKDCTHSSAGDVFLYDIVTQSWVYGNSRCSDSIRFTNFVTDWNGDLIYIETDDTGTPKKWSDASGSSTGLHIQTKDLDFGQPGVRKKIYKVYITYRGDASNVQVNYGSDGGALSGTFFTITSGTDGSTTGGSAAEKCLKNAGTDDWLKAELKPSASINNVSSFQLKLHSDGSNAVAADFEIDSISIVYRTKGIK